ncbi:MAG: hypothetical protein V1773_18470 [bacterium]
MQTIEFSNNTVNSFKAYIKNEPAKSKDTNAVDKKSDSIDISASSKAFKKIDDFLNLGKADRLDTNELNPAEKEEFLKMLSTLLKKGIVGYEILEVNGKPEKHYIVNQIGDERLKGAKLWKKDNYYNSKV